jgi:hypothetical protein
MSVPIAIWRQYDRLRRDAAYVIEMPRAGTHQRPAVAGLTDGVAKPQQPDAGRLDYIR